MSRSLFYTVILILGMMLAGCTANVAPALAVGALPELSGKSITKRFGIRR